MINHGPLWYNYTFVAYWLVAPGNSDMLQLTIIVGFVAFLDILISSQVYARLSQEFPIFSMVQALPPHV